MEPIKSHGTLLKQDRLNTLMERNGAMNQTGDEKKNITSEQYDAILQIAAEWAHWEYMKGAWRHSPNSPSYYIWAKEAKEKLRQYLDKHSDI